LAKGLTGVINRFCRDAPARLGCWLVMPFYRMGGAGAEKSRRYAQSIQDAFNNGAIPIGLSAAVSGLFLMLLFYFN
jgi:hypothetical protein